MINPNDTIFAKIRRITLGNIHTLLNKVIDLNSIADIEQHLRDLNQAKTDLALEAAGAEGRKRHVTKTLARKEGEAVGIDASIRTILGDANPDNDHLTKAMAVALLGVTSEVADLKTELDEAKATDLALDETVSQMTALVVSLDSQLARLRAKEESTKAKEKAADALQRASQVTGAGQGLKLDNVIERIEVRAETADAKLETAMANMKVAADTNVQMGEAEALLIKIKESMGQ
jgi:phage shock protein A